MSARYLAAFERIREILTARSQAEPLLEAREIRALAGAPWLPLRTTRRYVEAVRSDTQIQLARIGRDGQTGRRRSHRVSINEQFDTTTTAVHRQASGSPTS